MTFEASPNSISPGEKSQLSWNVTGARSVTLDNGIGPVALKGTRVVIPAATTTYVLTAAGQQGAVTATVQVIVGRSTGTPSPSLSPTINSFTATPSLVSPGSISVLSWNVTGASTASVSPDVGSVNPILGTQSVFPAITTNYILTATNSAGSVSQMVTITVGGSTPTGGMPVINTFEAVPNVIPLGGSTTLSWNVSGAGSVTITTGSGSMFVGGPTGSVVATPSATNTYTLQANNSSGMVSKTVMVLVGGGGGGGGISRTISLSPVAGETGTVYKDGTVATGVKTAGDTSGNVAMRCYFSYDLTALAGKNVDSAKLVFTTNSIVRNPFGNLGALGIGKVDYGARPLVATDYGLAGTGLVAAAAPPAEVNVTTSVKNALLAGDTRYHVQLKFAIETNNDNLADYIDFSNAVLTVSYTD
jgi:hypothetical protein